MVDNRAASGRRSPNLRSADCPLLGGRAMPYLIIKIRHRRKGGDGAGNMFCNAAGQFG